jgi:hypothetical protein
MEQAAFVHMRLRGGGTLGTDITQAVRIVAVSMGSDRSAIIVDRNNQPAMGCANPAEGSFLAHIVLSCVAVH